MLMSQAGNWRLMWMGQAFLVATQQSGPRGGDKIYSSNWGMLGAAHAVGKGAILLRSMVSLEPATVTDRRYPLLFQTGELAFGKPLVDAQHPHDLFMELSAQYVRPLSEKAFWNIYWAPVGEPPLGPVAYPHRASAMELPQAALSHHWQDSTHIGNNVLTTGITYGKYRLEGSGFHGREPNENRWNIDMGKFDSWATRFSVQATPNWMGQVSVGRLHNPEENHPDTVVRTTASVTHVLPRPGNTYWATSVIWGQNYSRENQRALNAVLLETVVPFKRKNFITGRYEWSQRDELFADRHDDDHAHTATGLAPAYTVGAYTLGYTRDVELIRHVQSGLGINVSAYAIDPGLKEAYGRSPWGLNVFLRVRVRRTE